MSNYETEHKSLSKEESVTMVNSFYHPNKADMQRMDEIIERFSNIKETTIYPDIFETEEVENSDSDL